MFNPKNQHTLALQYLVGTREKQLLRDLVPYRRNFDWFHNAKNQRYNSDLSPYGSAMQSKGNQIITSKYIFSFEHPTINYFSYKRIYCHSLSMQEVKPSTSATQI
jgi:hypothetical protein